MSAQFTPGPWQAKWMVGGAHYGVFQIRPFADRRRQFLLGNDKTVGTLEEGNANAHLIAAAPEMYEALAGMIGRYAKFGPFDEILGSSEQSRETNDALAALAKARGEQ